MAHLDFKISTNLHLESAELHIVLKALRNELTQDDLETARALHDTIIEHRNTRAKQWVETLKKQPLTQKPEKS